MADESVHSSHEVSALIRAEAVNLLHFQLLNTGGVSNLHSLTATAENAAIGYPM